MIRVEFTISRRHLFALVGILAVGVLAVPGVSWAAGRFDDVPDSSVFVADIEWLANAGITKGCNPPANTEFCPGSYVTREQMAAFMHRLAGGDSRTVDGRLDALEDLLAGVSRNGDTLLFDGMNLQVVNGMGNTSTSNSLGNLIIGYNEDEWNPSPRTGSHYLVVGKDHSWTSWAGILSGYKNTASAPHASVTGGFNNTASGEFASVTGGSSNHASATAATICGGEKNTASGEHSSVSGGSDNTASAGHTSVSGGFTNTASLNISSILGGSYNTANGFYSTVSGGTYNTASGYAASVLGGLANTASINNYASVCGGYDNTASGLYSSVLGGSSNTASGESSSMSGGSGNTAAGDCSSVVGGDDVYLTSGGLTCRTAGEGFWNAAD